MAGEIFSVLSLVVRGVDLQKKEDKKERNFFLCSIFFDDDDEKKQNVFRSTL